MAFASVRGGRPGKSHAAAIAHRAESSPCSQSGWVARDDLNDVLGLAISTLARAKSTPVGPPGTRSTSRIRGMLIA
jgi:hypothetical protein